MEPGSLIERAQRFIWSGGVHEADLLKDCVADGGASALAAVLAMAEDMYGGITFNFEIKAPAAFTLLAFGVQGVHALREMAERTPTSKNTSLCLSVLAAAAAGVQPHIGQMFVRDDTLQSAVRSSIAKAEVADSARTELREYVLAFADEADAISAVGNQLWQTGWGEDPRIAGELFAALAARKLAISPATLKTYQKFIGVQPDDEPTFQLFFEQHPQLLDPTAAEAWSKPDLAGAREPDFVVRRTDDTYLIIEIETPAKVIVTAANQLSAAATQAVAQATAYRSFLVERFPLAVAHFPRFSEPDCLVVIGLEESLNQDQRASLARENQSRAHVRIAGFNWIASRAHAVFKNVVEQRTTTRSLRVL